jgi:hypothetical protein
MCGNRRLAGRAFTCYAERMEAAPGIASRHGIEAKDDTDVPAAVLCAVCGRSDCAGCPDVEGKRPATGTPWEQNDVPRLRRLWSTAILATIDGESFFGELGDGSVGAALGFALLCELFAIASLAVLWLPVSYVLVPRLVESIFWSGERSSLAVAGVIVAVPLLALLMVLLHVLWGTSLEFGLRLSGAEPRTGHCLRYALYSCGWDLVTSPFGFTAGCVSSGVRGAIRELRAAIRVPRFATRAYVGRARKLPDSKARRALALAAAMTGTVVIASAVAVAFMVVAALVEP